VLRKIKDIFSPQKANQLPPQRKGVDHEIATDGANPPRRRIYSLTRTETEAIKAYLDKMLGKGSIRPSTSPYASPVLIVKKPREGLRICVDYRQLNAITQKNRNAPPAIKETLSRIARVKVMSIVNVIAAFDTVRVKEGNKKKTAFLTQYGLYEYVVMPFGLCNAPGTFQTFINETLREYLDDFCTAYLDNVLIYSKRKEDHKKHVLKVLAKLQAANLYLDATKYKFKVKRVKYLDLILTTNGLEIDPAKISTVLKWQLPRNIKDVQSFLGFANFYRRFIRGFSVIAKPLTTLTKKEGASFPLIPGSKEVNAFTQLKEAFKEATMLAHFNPDLETWLETDASDYVTAAVLSQMHKGVLQPVAFLSHKITPAKCNYEVYDKELLAIVQAFEEWRFELARTQDPIKVLSDHQALQWFMTNKRLNRRQARWAEFLAEFNFKVTHRPGKQGMKPDALTRRPGDLPESADDARRQHQWQTVIKPDRVGLMARVAHMITRWVEGSRHAVYLASCLCRHHLVERPRSTPLEVAHMMYNLSEEDTVPEGYAYRCMAVQTLAPLEDAPLEETAPEDEPVDLMDLIRAAYGDDPVLRDIIEAKKAGARRIPHKLIHEGHLRLELGDCALYEGLLYVRGKVFIPDARNIQTAVLDQVHRSLCGGHGGKHKSYAKLSRWYY
jgi:hypothetical protein